MTMLRERKREREREREREMNWEEGIGRGKIWEIDSFSIAGLDTVEIALMDE